MVFYLEACTTPNQDCYTISMDILIAHGTLEHALLDRKDWLDIKMLGFEP